MAGTAFDRFFVGVSWYWPPNFLDAFFQFYNRLSTILCVFIYSQYKYSNLFYFNLPKNRCLWLLFSHCLSLLFRFFPFLGRLTTYESSKWLLSIAPRWLTRSPSTFSCTRVIPSRTCTSTKLWVCNKLRSSEIFTTLSNFYSIGIFYTYPIIFRFPFIRRSLCQNLQLPI